VTRKKRRETRRSPKARDSVQGEREEKRRETRRSPSHLFAFGERERLRRKRREEAVCACALHLRCTELSPCFAEGDARRSLEELGARRELRCKAVSRGTRRISRELFSFALRRLRRRRCTGALSRTHIFALRRLRRRRCTGALSREIRCAEMRIAFAEGEAKRDTVRRLRQSAESAVTRDAPRDSALAEGDRYGDSAVNISP